MNNGHGSLLDVYLSGYEFHHQRSHPFRGDRQWRIASYTSLNKFMREQGISNGEVRCFLVWVFICYALMGGENGAFGSLLAGLWKLYPEFEQWKQMNKENIVRDGLGLACIAERKRLLAHLPENMRIEDMEDREYAWAN